MSESTSDLETQPGDELLGELAEDFLRRHRAGQRPSVEEYAIKHPELAPRIRDLFPAVIVMEQPGAVATADFAPAAERVGATIGRYKLLERIGEGGFGVVFMAEQQHPVRRKVALKVIKPGIDTRQVIARFEAERQALALMDHENIAKVLDAGATDSGRPYFVMELVHGVPITEYCDNNQLATRERLELFVEVCRAVQHAHTKGIIHRDIKPTNVLVTLHEGVPVPKVIDFGVAKATGQQLTEKTLFTNFAQMVGTPLYMSPEQAEMTGVDVDTRSDVYSLGVLLYELLTGTTPLDKELLKQAAFDEVRRIIREEEPPRPSTRLSTMGEQARTISAAQRKCDPKQLGRLMRGELDWIVMKALAKERARRYETASACAADVQRYLRDEPVEACPPSAWYRFGKFARRQKAVLGAVSGVALLVLAAAGILAVSNMRISEALERERRNSYGQRIALADREWSANNLSGMEVLLEECPDDLRGWEWHYIKRLRYHTLLPLRHEGPVLSVGFSPDGKLLATGTQPGVVRIWQTRTGQQLREWPAHQANATAVVFSPDGRYLATGSWDSTVKIWDVEKVLQGEIQTPLHSFNQFNTVRGIAFSPGGQRLACAGGQEGDEKWEVKVWDLNTAQEVLTLSGITEMEGVMYVQFSPDGRRLATCGKDVVRVWDAHTGREQLTRRDPQGRFQQVVFSPDGRRLAAAGGLIAVHPSGEVKVWNAESGEEIFSMRGHVGGLRSVAYSPDGRRLASTGLDQTIKLWDASTGQEVLTLRGHLDNVFNLAFSADGHLLASASLDNTVRIWDATPLGREPTPEHLTLSGHTGAVTDVAFHPTDERSLVSAGTDGRVCVWDFRNGKELATLHESPSRLRLRVAYSHDGRRLAVVSGDQKEVSVWDVTTAQRIVTFQGHHDWPLSLAFSPDGQHIASAGFDAVVLVWDATTGEEDEAFQDHSWPIHGVAFRPPDGRHLATGSADNTVRVRDWITGEVLGALEPGHAARVANLAFSHDGKRLASASWDRTVKVWDADSWRLLHDLPHASAVNCVAFDRDGPRLAWGSTDGTVAVWDGPDSEPFILRGHTSWVQAVAFSPEGKWIASASLDGTVKIWHAPPEPKTPAQEAAVREQ